MKKIIKILFVLLSLSTSAMAQKGFEVNQEITVNVSAAELWELIGPGFVEVYKWSSNVDHAKGAGIGQFEGAVCDERFCDVNVKGFNKISEKVTKYDQQNMSLTYAVQEGMPGFVTKAQNEWTVIPIGRNQAKLVMKAKFSTKGLMGTLMNGMMKKKMSKTLATVLNDAKIYVETGEVSVEKQERIDSLAKKLAV